MKFPTEKLNEKNHLPYKPTFGIWHRFGIDSALDRLESDDAPDNLRIVKAGWSAWLVRELEKQTKGDAK